ncbi:ROK family protein [Salipiger sp. PrR007]|uniref:glucokinase n=1 Tax=Salipiger sp. PrR007 TaxID=2706884 RepID=UPI0013BBAFA4|nr:ROK family protein [Salipiger sp. PrR007]NDW31935.1 ROK family protein [Salipiger sp. PrR007]
MSSGGTAVLADIGGTNTRVALCEGSRLIEGSVMRYRNAENDGIGAVLKHYLAEKGATVDAACVAVAGPVRDGAGRLTNIDWEIDRPTLAEATGAETISVLNDLQAQGHALGHIAEDCLTPILPGLPASPQAARLVVGIGTGMNAAPVFRLGERTLVPPSEAGHVAIPVQTDDEMRLLRYIERKHQGPSVEHILSGRGFERVYAWLCDEDGAGEPLEAQQIMAAAQAGTDERALRAIEVFVRMMGRVCSNLALTTLPFGGIYLIGGVARHFGPYLTSGAFEQAFCDRGRFAEFMTQFPVSLVTDDYAALTGCACHLSELP